MERFRFLFDILDVALVSFVFYHMLLLVRGTRAAQMFIGLALLMVASVVGSILGLEGLNWIVDNLKTIWVIAFVILFQPELRRALASVGASRLFRNFIHTDGQEPIGEIVDAATRLAEQGQGALIVLEREAELRSYQETGTRIESQVTSELLETIFTPPFALARRRRAHPRQPAGGGRLHPAAGADPRLPATLGTRHRAALGIAEETDAVVIVVSEETRTISLAIDGRLRLRLDPLTLRTELRGAVRAAGQQAQGGVSRPGAPGGSPSQGGESLQGLGPRVVDVQHGGDLEDDQHVLNALLEIAHGKVQVAMGGAGVHAHQHADGNAGQVGSLAEIQQDLLLVGLHEIAQHCFDLGRLTSAGQHPLGDDHPDVANPLGSHRHRALLPTPRRGYGRRVARQ